MNEVHAHALPAGTLLEGFEITDILGTGSFGITYKATDHTLEREVAIKEYLPSGLAYREADSRTLSPVSQSSEHSYAWGLRRFLDEARVLARFNEPSIIRVIRYLEANGTAYFVMDYLAGESLYERIGRNPMSEAEARALLHPLLKGLATVHENHYLHRDIKPHNIYLREDGFPILLDFGCARQHLGQAANTMTVMGSPAYAPFEQLHDGDQPLPSADLYSLGATVFHCVYGRPPPVCTKRITELMAGTEDPLSDGLAEIAAAGTCGEAFLNVLDWMLSPYPADRPQTAGDVIAALEGGDLDDLRRGSDGKRRQQQVCMENMDTMPAGTPPATTGTGSPWEESLLQDLEAVLARYIGPRSLELVRGVAAGHRDFPALVEALARFIPAPDRRAAFRARVHEVTGREVVAPAPAAPAPPSNPGFDAELLARLREELAEYLGPIAGVLVKRYARSAPNRDALLRELADELPDHSSAEAFLARMRKP
ncbi:MAG: serine/threonine-protein kinase [Gammaproteobacteria bacterium]|nr:serine/threonine-protein kinase [Gammaproteobacteria bacterium]